MTKAGTRTLDNLWSRLIKLRAKGKCEYCRRPDTLNSHHIFSRSNRSTRWDERNGVCLCAGHHSLNNISAHKAPMIFMEWLKKERGETWYKTIQIRAMTAAKIDYKLTKLYLEHEIRKYVE